MTERRTFNDNLIADAAYFCACSRCNALIVVRSKPRSDQPHYCESCRTEARKATNRKHMRRRYHARKVSAQSALRAEVV